MSKAKVILKHVDEGRDKCIVVREGDDVWGAGYWHPIGQSHNPNFQSAKNWMCSNSKEWREITIEEVKETLSKEEAKNIIELYNE